METVAARDAADDFVGLIERRIDPAYRLARAILADDAEAEDAVQDACIAAWRRRRSLRERTSFDPWFDRIVINGCRDRLRVRQRQRVRAIALVEQVRLQPEAVFADRDDGLDVAFDALDRDHRVVVLLRFWLDLPLADIAERLEIPLGTVKSRLHHALRAIRARLEATDGRS